MTALRTMAFASLLIAACAPSAVQAAPTETVLYSFSNALVARSGQLPSAGLAQGADGALYGVTEQGGGTNCDCGVVFRLTRPAVGKTQWTETVIHSFEGYPNDGGVPFANLIFDTKGNLYGTTLLGGTQQYGTVFMLSPPAAGAKEWQPHILHSFAGPPADGTFPHASLSFDGAGNLYGTATLGGAGNYGAVFKLATDGSYSLPHSFAGGDDGALPEGSLIFDAQGNAYGTTLTDGVDSVQGGTVFRLAPDGTGTVLHSFSGSVFCCPRDVGLPSGQLAMDRAGNIYGTGQVGGDGQVALDISSDAGGVFRLSPPSAGGSRWRETLLYSFNDNSTDGGCPTGGVTLGAADTLYGLTTDGGAGLGGTAYRLSRPAGGGTGWIETQLYQFGFFYDGGIPQGTLLRSRQGDFYGATMNGTALLGQAGIGTVFEITP